ncbi:hypothetical protein [Idiomarina aminovorans]|uniref:hypothetical protein n=1 Tax=Idiomarina aminovorans TaxID=2914829 RepID=UPI00200610D5|nr:hypothetical protein [Idiomarina sp. ATCH4]MCK7458005.1 hypothetical protein [Idiomarina sp. ATCH4]
MEKTNHRALSIFKVGFLVMGMGIVNTAMADEVTKKLEACAQIENDERRLFCLDKLIASLASDERKASLSAAKNSAESEKSLKVSPNNTMPQIASTGRDGSHTESSNHSETSFGIESREKETIVQKIYATIVKINKSRFRDTTYELGNGQIWAKKDSSRLKIMKGDEIYIERGALSSFYLGKDSQNTRTKVNRIK